MGRRLKGIQNIREGFVWSGNSGDFTLIELILNEDRLQKLRTVIGRLFPDGD